MRLGVRWKLIGGFGVVMLLLAVVAGVGVMKLGEVANNTNIVGTKQLPAVAYAYDAEVALTAMQRDLVVGAQLAA